MNATAEFTDFLRALGLRPRAVVADGRIRRCPTEAKPKGDNGAFMLAADGRFGWAQDWATHLDPITWRPEREPAPISAEAAAAAQRRRDDEAHQRRAREEAASRGAREFYAAAVPLLGGHGYLAAKGLDMAGCRGLRVDADGWLVVPMLRAGQIVSVQRIATDGTKRFWPGAPTSGASYVVERERATLTVLCEGLATGLAIYAAVPTARVVVAFNAGNLARVAAALPARGMVAVAADNDHATAERIGRNPGIEAAEAAARVLGCGVAAPRDVAGTDWLDLRNERIAAHVATGFGRRARPDDAARRAADAEIARAIQGAARFRSAAG